MSENIKIIADKNEIDNIANAVREKISLTEKMSLSQIANNIRAISGGGGVSTADATITSGNQLLKDITAYGTDGKITGTIPSQAGYNIIPNDNSQVAIAAGTYAAGDIVVEAIPDEYVITSDATATSNDIADGVTAYANGEKITGTFTIAEEIETQEEKIAAQDNIINTIMTALEDKAAGGEITVPVYNMQETTISYNVSSSYGYINIKYLATDDNGFIQWQTTDNLTGQGTIVIESLSNAWLYAEGFQNNMFIECGLSIAKLDYSDEQTYKVIAFYGDGAYGVIGPGYSYSIQFTTGGGE